MSADLDQFWMNRALAEARRGLGFVEPNPMVGAVVVAEGRVVGVGHHERFGGPHAEVFALKRAGELAKGATLYVTLEPCCHHGKTPPCTEAILESGVSRVVAAIRDPFPRVDGGGTRRLREAGVDVEVGVLAEASRRLNGPYLKRLVTSLPYVTAKWAMTLDGKTATQSGDSQWISSVRSRALVHETRGRMDAIVVGIGTVLADDPRLDARPPGPRTALRVILDSAGRLPLEGQLARTCREIPVVVAVTDRTSKGRIEALEAAGCVVLRFPGQGTVPIRPLLEELGQRGATNLLVEGGGRVMGAFLDAGQVDEVEVFVAPIIEGGAHGSGPAQGAGQNLMADALRLVKAEVSVIDGDVRIQGLLDQGWRRSFEVDDTQEQSLSCVESRPMAETSPDLAPER